jgi:hypothetical protein
MATISNTAAGLPDSGMAAPVIPDALCRNKWC